MQVSDITKMTQFYPFTLVLHTLLLHMQKAELVDIFSLLKSKKPTTHNAPIHTECKTLRHVVTSSAECETATVFAMFKLQFTSDACYNNLDICNHQLQLFLIIVLLKTSSKIILPKRDLNPGISSMIGFVINMQRKGRFYMEIVISPASRVIF